MIKIFIGIYILIGLLCSPLIYSNNALSYLSHSDYYKYGQAIGSSFYWPSYIFAIEPKIDGSSEKNFEKSILEIVNYRNDKLYSKSQDTGIRMLNAIGYCIIDNGLDITNENIYNLYKNLFQQDKTEDDNLKKIKKKVINMFDNNDFADVIKIGDVCMKRIYTKK